MNGFWKNEWELFKVDLANTKSFFMQPIEITLWGKSDKMLRPSMEETNQKAATGDVGFWKNEWDLFKKDLSSLEDFLNQPVTFK